MLMNNPPRPTFDRLPPFCALDWPAAGFGALAALGGRLARPSACVCAAHGWLFTLLDAVFLLPSSRFANCKHQT